MARILWLIHDISEEFDMQFPVFFKGDVWENLCLGEAFAEETVRAILAQVHFTSRPGEDPLHVTVDKGGSNLSGGEKARLELARALLRKKPLILVDEITANLDQTHAKGIRKLLHQSDATVIEIAHHYSDASLYDAVWEIQDQKIIRKEVPL